MPGQGRVVTAAEHAYTSAHQSHVEVVAAVEQLRDLERLQNAAPAFDDDGHRIRFGAVVADEGLPRCVDGIKAFGDGIEALLRGEQIEVRGEDRFPFTFNDDFANEGSPSVRSSE